MSHNLQEFLDEEMQCNAHARSAMNRSTDNKRRQPVGKAGKRRNSCKSNSLAVIEKKLKEKKSDKTVENLAFLEQLSRHSVSAATRNKIVGKTSVKKDAVSKDIAKKPTNTVFTEPDFEKFDLEFSL